MRIIDLTAFDTEPKEAGKSGEPGTPLLCPTCVALLSRQTMPTIYGWTRAQYLAAKARHFNQTGLGLPADLAGAAALFHWWRLYRVKPPLDLATGEPNATAWATRLFENNKDFLL